MITKAGSRSAAFRWVGGALVPVPAPPEPPVAPVGGGLRSQFFPDAESVFLILSEFAEVREFKITENNVDKFFTTNVVWDTETLKDRAIVQQQGLFIGDVRCFILSRLFAVEPKPEQILYTRRLEPLPAETIFRGWRVLDITDAEEMYYLDLDKFNT